jgi:hypothetical protein
VIIDSVQVLPQIIVPFQNFTVSVIVRNIGFTTSGPFAVAGTFPPNNAYLTTFVPGLAPGQYYVATLNGILSNTGFFTSALLIDASNQVPEGANGEFNNVYNFSYRVDHAVRNQGTQTLNLGDTIDLEGDRVQGDANWNADGESSLGLDGIFGARLGILAGIDFNAIHWDLINPGIINREQIPYESLFPGTLIGIITADGNRGVMQVNAVSSTQLIVTFRVYL